GVPPTFLVTPTGIDFGTVAVGSTSPIEEADVINRGLAPVVVSGAGGAPGGAFGGSQNCEGKSLAPGESCQISYTFSPTSPGDASATSSGSWNGQPYRVELFGFGGTPYILVDVDIMPGDPLNEVNLRARGGLPVAILGSPDFDATTIDPATVTLADAPVIVRPNGRIAAASEDVNGDGIADLVVHVDRSALNLAADATFALLEGQTTDGTAIRGVDGVTIVP
ncbi:MAG: choice-of-anchor D domain-containing protein, partial [Gemmatimonadota bacterium]